MLSFSVKSMEDTRKMERSAISLSSVTKKDGNPLKRPFKRIGTPLKMAF